MHELSTPNPEAVERSFRTLEYSFTIGTNVPELPPIIDRLLGRFAAERVDGSPTYGLWSAPAGRFLQTLDGVRMSEESNTLRLVYGIIWDVQQASIRSARKSLVIHGAAAARRSDVILLPAPMDSGKSTLVTSLVRAGLDYVTDDAIVVNESGGIVQPFAKPIRLETRSVSLLGGAKRLCLRRPVDPSLGFSYFDPDEIRPGCVSQGGTARFIIMLQLRPGTGTRLVPVTKGAGLMALAGNMFDLPSFGGEGLSILRRVVEGATCYRLEVDDLPSATAAVLSLADG